MDNQIKIPNRLIDEKSPYLLQHAYNPVGWFPWGEEAFEKAKAEKKPVFLSIGYSTCHWCHVMAHESFEDAEIAAILNKHFVSIKVDREERPDIDSIYMQACQTLTGSGGWPLSIFLTEDKLPFFAGTYFPKTARYGSAGFIELLDIIRVKWAEDRALITRSSKEIHAFLEKNAANAYKTGADEDAAGQALAVLKATFDPVYGGFGRAPKFPMPHTLLFLMYSHSLPGCEPYLHMVEKTLDGMRLGGIFDHIGYGFSRYSTDGQWLAPHFEKMLYDNALLIAAYAYAHSLTGRAEYRETVCKTAAYIARELTHPEGGFYSAQDADSEGAEGKYYLFRPDEITAVLGEEAGKRLNACLDITEQGNFEGQSIPNLIKSRAMSPEVEKTLPLVYAYRKERYPLHVDDKSLTSWNGLMIGALAFAGIALKESRFIDMAKSAAAFIEKNLASGGRLHTSFRDGKLSGAGFLDDYAFYALGLLLLHQATLDEAYLVRAAGYADTAIQYFFHAQEGGFYLYASDAEQLILRPKETYDGAMPSGNAAMTLVLALLFDLLGDETYLEALTKQLNFMRAAAHNPGGHNFYLLALQYTQRPLQKVICAHAPNEPAPNLRKTYFHALLRLIPGGSAHYPLREGKTTYYICENGVCRKPEVRG